MPATTKTDATPDKQAYLESMYAASKELRGAFIDQAIWLDMLVTEILAIHFVPDKAKRALFASDILMGPDSSFSGRINVLRKVVTRTFPNFHSDAPGLFDKLDKIRRFRNRLAHAHLDTSEAFLEKRVPNCVQLVFYDDGESKTQVVTFQEIRTRLIECSETVNTLLRLQTLVSEA